jgi:hypothetical protein
MKRAELSATVIARVPPDLAVALRRRASAMSVPVSDITRHALTAYLSQKPEGLVMGKVFS